VAALALLVAVAVLGSLAIAWSRRARTLTRLSDADAGPGASTRLPSAPPAGALARWLARAGYTGAAAPTTFVVTTLAGIIIGAGMFATVRAGAGVVNATLLDLPGSVGETFAAAVDTLPWMALVLCVLAPTLHVRAARRARVTAVEHDLPLLLELLATLAQAGLGFDTALARVVDVQDGNRPLTREFRRFQGDMLSGVPRLVALRHLATRLDVTSLTVFVAAVIQAEQIGASMAETLRHQADDMRSRRRDRALLASQSLPVKLVLPLVVCFLPGIFLSTLGPVLHQMVQVANTVLRPVGP
jgi:tight adherence protein C